ncbi:hypothetical protein PPYR_13541 [Photinus pyralis]|uniref:Uncharacterized protein n=1 Tax=Photinus pyralis TaxID=7054 RepID=A0A5N4A9C5_PHOPY|nr:uncharacterized protein LOC116178942 isoform X2 [Photinus pyralis]KAB0793921.1 hypothetical protein PPYR_13541 [Photinus pyralis]
MLGHVVFAALLIVFEPLVAFPSEYGRRYPLGQNDGCRFNGDCEFVDTRLQNFADNLGATGSFGIAKRLERFKISNRDDTYGKRKAAALDSLVAGGMFGKAKRAHEYDYLLKDTDIDKFQRSSRPLLNTMELGGTFGRAVKRQVLDTLGSNAFGVQKRKVDSISDQGLKAFLNKNL